MKEQAVTEATLGPIGVAYAPARIAALLRTPLYANTFYLWANAAVIALGGFAFWTLAARLYDSGDIGLGSAALSAMMLLALISPLGLGLGLIRFIPGAADRPLLINSSFTVGALVAVASSSVFLLGLPIWSPRLEFLREHPVHVVAFVAFCAGATVASIQDQAFVAFRRAKFVLLKGVGLNLVRIVLLGVTVLFSAAFGIVAAGGLATLVALALGYFFLRWVEPGYGPAIVLDRQLVRKLLPFSFGNYGADLALFAPGLILPMMVVNVLGAESGGHFYVGWFIGYLLVWSISMYAAMSLFAEGSYDEESLARLTRNALILALAAVAIGVGAILLVGDKVLLAFGNEYADEATNLLRLVAVSALPATLVNVYLATERVRGNLGALVAVASVVAIVTLAISYPLLRTMGIAGAGVGLLVGQGLGAIIAIMRLFLGVWSREKRGSPGSGLAVAGVRPRKGGRFDRGC